MIGEMATHDLKLSVTRIQDRCACLQLLIAVAMQSPDHSFNHDSRARSRILCPGAIRKPNEKKRTTMQATSLVKEKTILNTNKCTVEITESRTRTKDPDALHHFEF